MDSEICVIASLPLPSVAQEYEHICSELGVDVVPILEESLRKQPSKIDTSLFYVLPNVVETIIQLIDRRSEIEELNLTGLRASSDLLVRLFGVLKKSCVRELTLKNVAMDVTAGQSLKELCTELKSLTNIDISGCMLPEHLEFAIEMQVELNMLGAQEKSSTLVQTVESEAPKLWRWRMESLSEPDLTVTRSILLTSTKSVSIRETMQRVIDSHVLYVDKEFPPEAAVKNVEVEWVRLGNLVHDVNKRDVCCVGGRSLCFSQINDTRNLCAALNVVQHFSDLKRHVCVRRLPDVGMFIFRFFENDMSVEVVIDDLIPCIKSNNSFQPAGIHHMDGSDDFWGCLVEKALAKLHGGYKNIAGIGFGSALSLLTGGVSFVLDWNSLKKHVTESEMFKFVVDLINSKKVLASMCIPRNEMVSRSLKEYGICPYNSYVITAAEAFRTEQSSRTLAVQLSSPDETRYQYAIDTPKNTDNALFLPRYWMSFQDYLTHFGRTYMLLWPQSDPSINRKYLVEHQCNCNGGPDSTSTFATNPSFLLENKGGGQSVIMLHLRKKSSKGANDWIQIHVYKGSNPEDKVHRRYDISFKNELFSTRKSTDREVTLLFRMRAGERLQITVSSFPKCECALRVSSFESFQLVPLPSYYEFTVRGRWKRNDPKRVSITLVNKNNDKVDKLVVALSQEPVEKRIVAMGVEMLLNCESSQGLSQKSFCTAFKTEVVIVLRLAVTLQPGDSITLIPTTRNDPLNVAFSMSVFCDHPLCI